MNNKKSTAKCAILQIIKYVKYSKIEFTDDVSNKGNCPAEPNKSTKET